MSEEVTTPSPDVPDIAAIRERYEKADKGPWILHVYNVPNDPVYALETGGDEELDGGEFGQLHGGEWNAQANGEFIAHARHDVPQLCDYITHLLSVHKAERERLEAELAECRSCLSVEGRNHFNTSERFDAFKVIAEARKALLDLVTDCALHGRPNIDWPSYHRAYKALASEPQQK